MSAANGKQTVGTLVANGRTVDYRVKTSNTAKLLRVRVGLGGVEVVRPKARQPEEVDSFLTDNAQWVADQVDRVERLRAVQRAKQTKSGILFRGQETPVVAVLDAAKRGPNKVVWEGGQIRVECGLSGIEPQRSLKRWLRSAARSEILPLVKEFARKVRRQPGRVYVMDQRTKWGNCSALGNLSFSWRLVLAPPYVMRYLVAHEVVHLAVPDHSKRFWLTLQSVCKDTDRARQWLVANEAALRGRFAGLGGGRA